MSIGEKLEVLIKREKFDIRKTHFSCVISKTSPYDMLRVTRQRQNDLLNKNSLSANSATRTALRLNTSGIVLVTLELLHFYSDKFLHAVQQASKGI